MTDWKTYKIKIGDICTRVCSGGTPKSTESAYYGGDIPWLNTKEINFNRIYTTEKSITHSGLDNSSAKWIAPDSVIVAMYGATAAKVAINKIPLTTNQACCNLTIDNNIADYRYVYYYLCNNYSLLASLANGGAQQNLNAQQIKDFEILLPPLAEQKRIAGILGALDDKIELNRRINANLEEQAKALYKSWFVDFDQFNGNKPDNWHEGILREIITSIYSGGTPNTGIDEFWGGDIPWFSSGETRHHFVVSTEKTITQRGVDNSSTRLAHRFDVVMASAGQGFTRGQTSLLMIDTYVNQSVIVMSSQSPLYLYFNLLGRYDELRAISDSSSIRGSINTKMLAYFPMLIPPTDVLNKFTKLISPLIGQIENNLQESARLTALRDTLLPKLMNGEILM